MDKIKSIPITKRMVWTAYLQVKRNKGAHGVDNQTLAQFDNKLKDNLYKLWNRLASGSYFPPAVRLVEIPKKSGGKRPLGIPTVADRIAQTVITNVLMPKLDPKFDNDSYGYRPRKSAVDAVAVARKRTWKSPWVVDMDIKGFFDNIDHELLMVCLKHVITDRWVWFYVKRWLTVDMISASGEVISRTAGTPQGGVISPLLANLFLHYVFDAWMRKYHPGVEFVRYADDIIVHCKNETQAKMMMQVIANRCSRCKLMLHPEKTKIVYTGSVGKSKEYPDSFDFLGFTFRKRFGYSAKTGKGFVTTLPAISNTAKKTLHQIIKSWRLHRQTSVRLEVLAKQINPVVRGWVNYYGKFYRSELTQLLYQIEKYLRRWAQHKYAKKTGLTSKKQARKYLGKARKHNPYLFEHWRYGMGSPIE